MNSELVTKQIDHKIARNISLLKYFDTRDKKALLIIPIKTIRKILYKTSLPEEVVNIIADFVVPNLDKMYIRDTRDLYNQMSSDELSIYTHILGNKWYPIPLLDMTNINSKSLIYHIRSSFMYVIFYYMLLDFNIYIIKSSSDNNILTKIEDSQTVCFNFSCNASCIENNCYRLLLENRNMRR